MNQQEHAAQYIRMSTEHQQYSTANQQDAIMSYAKERGFTIVKTYADEGKSGLRVKGRASLRQLIADVEAGDPGFSAVLVYDISRWGRFQDADESAYYEYLCKRAGIAVHYCAEQFENDGRPTSAIIKSVKRAMAGEYSRELSAKVFKGQCRLIELGYRQGGAAGYGLRRMLVDGSGKQKGELTRGEHKSLQTDRVILVPGPRDEVETVQWIYDQFTRKGLHESEIAKNLNAQKILTDLGRPWTRGTVRSVLTNEKYIGNNVYNRTSFKLKQEHVRNDKEMWIRKDRAFEAIVSTDLFYMARGMFFERNRRFTDEEMLNRLKALLEQNQTISASLIDAADDSPSSAAYRSRFGTLLNAYQLVGHTPDRDFSYVETNRELRALGRRYVDQLAVQLSRVGASIRQDESTGLLIVNEEYSANLVLSRYRETKGGSPRWLVRLDQAIAPDITILARMDPDNRQPSDFYLLPIMDISDSRLLLCETNGVHIDTYQFKSLDYFAQLAARTDLETAA